MINFLKLLAKYKKEEKIWRNAGKPVRSPEKIAEIHKICSECPVFQEGKGHVPGYDKCGICECNLHESRTVLNKIAWGTTECPYDPPKWGPEVPPDEQIDG